MQQYKNFTNTLAVGQRVNYGISLQLAVAGYTGF